MTMGCEGVVLPFRDLFSRFHDIPAEKQLVWNSSDVIERRRLKAKYKDTGGGEICERNYVFEVGENATILPIIASDIKWENWFRNAFVQPISII